MRLADVAVNSEKILCFLKTEKNTDQYFTQLSSFLLNYTVSQKTPRVLSVKPLPISTLFTARKRTKFAARNVQ